MVEPHLFVPVGYLGHDMEGMLAVSASDLGVETHVVHLINAPGNFCIKTNLLGYIYVSNGVMTGRAV